MIVKVIRLIFGCLLLIANNMVLAKTAVTAGYGSGNSRSEIYRLNIQRAWSSHAKQSRFTGYWELAFTKVNSNDKVAIANNNSTRIFSASAALRIPYRFVLDWVVDIGFGFANSSDRVVVGRDLGSNLVFEDRVGISILPGRARRLEIGYRFIHYSNAYLAETNQGLNIHLFTLGYWFY